MDPGLCRLDKLNCDQFLESHFRGQFIEKAATCHSGLVLYTSRGAVQRSHIVYSLEEHAHPGDCVAHSFCIEEFSVQDGKQA